MPITTTTTTQITVEDNGVLSVRIGKRAFDDDGTLIGERYHRVVFEPGDDVSTQPALLQRVANAVWTPALVTKYRADKAANEAKALAKG
jgi:hypothetical protein